MHKNPQVLLQYVIQNLGLSITLGMIHCAHAQLSAIDFKELLPETAHKNWVSVENQAFWKSM